MSSVIEKAKMQVPLRWKCMVSSILKPEKEWLQYADSKQRRVFVFLAGFYQNLGDMAITYAQIKFLQRIHPDALIIPVPNEETFAAIAMIKRYIRKDDLVTITGGGNMSDLYYHLENARREVIRSFPENTIISFPQTVFFTDSSIGKRELSNSRRIYRKHRHLKLFARDYESFIRMRQYFPGCNVFLSPDIVLSLDQREPKVRRAVILVCLRDDKERSIPCNFKRELTRAVKSVYPSVYFTDTTTLELKDCLPDTYESTLCTFWNKIKSARVVLTDRLHCMLFCAITGTPCVALDNSNHKVLNSFKTWLKDISYIRTTDSTDINEILMTMKEVELCSNMNDLALLENEWFKVLIEGCK